MRIYNQLISRRKLKELFDSISTYYESTNKVLSLGLDKKWRDKLADFAEGVVLDLACGTGEMTSRFSCKNSVSKVFGADMSKKMMKWGLENKKFCREVNFVASYAESLPFKDDTFDTVCVAFGLRNFENLSSAISEIKRVLKNRGKFISIDTLKPTSAILPFYKFYLLYIIPSITSLLLGKKNEYIYMAKSILNYMTQEELTDFLKSFNFENIKHINLTFGIVTITICENRKV